MKIKNVETLKQALASMRLENLHLPPDVDALVKQALAGQTIDTEDIKYLLRKPYLKTK